MSINTLTIIQQQQQSNKNIMTRQIEQRIIRNAKEYYNDTLNTKGKKSLVQIEIYKKNQVICIKCKKQIKIGELYHTQEHGGHRSKFRHSRCMTKTRY